MFESQKVAQTKTREAGLSDFTSYTVIWRHEGNVPCSVVFVIIPIVYTVQVTAQKTRESRNRVTLPSSFKKNSRQEALGETKVLSGWDLAFWIRPGIQLNQPILLEM